MPHCILSADAPGFKKDLLTDSLSAFFLKGKFFFLSIPPENQPFPIIKP